MPFVRFPTALAPGQAVRLVAPSSGVRAPLWPRLDRAVARLRAMDLAVDEAPSLRHQERGASGPAAGRAHDWQRAMTEDGIGAVLPPWGGERAIELLRHLDFDAIAAARPRWFAGFSDVSTLQLPLLLRAGIASLHGPNLMEMGAAVLDETTAAMLAAWRLGPGSTLVQRSSAQHQVRGEDWAASPEAGFRLDTPTRIRRLDGRDEPLALQGRLVGGCLDTLSRLAGTPFGDLPAFVRRHREAGEGTLLFVENAELSPFELGRAMQSLRLHGWLDGLAGLLVGRHAPAVGAAPPASGFGFDEALHEALGDLDLPVLLDLDIGHVPPQWTLVQGARATLAFGHAACTLTQHLD